MTDHVEEAIKALPRVHQCRMAHLVLRGWHIQCSLYAGDAHNLYGKSRQSWTARLQDEVNEELDAFHNAYRLKIYSATTLLTLLDQMVGVVKEHAEC